MKAFHLVKQDADSPTSKGYCFVEFTDPATTPVAVIGLNGMDLGGGKVLTARVAGERSGAAMTTPEASIASAAVAAAVVPPGVLPDQAAAAGPPPSGAVIVNGYDVEELVDAAMGLKPMPTAPIHIDQFGVPITRASPPMNPMMSVSIPHPQHVPVIQPTQQLQPVPQPAASAVALPPGSSALDIANAALDAAFGMGNVAPPPQQESNPTRILVLFNMVADEDLATDEEYQGLVDEVQGECAKYGKLLGMKIPRAPSDLIDHTAIKKIFLEYATSQDAVNAERELAGRQFGPNVVSVSFPVFSL